METTVGETFVNALKPLKATEQLDLGCVLRHGAFEVLYENELGITVGKPETALMFFFLRLLARLQSSGTVAAMDIDAYGKAL